MVAARAGGAVARRPDGAVPREVARLGRRKDGVVTRKLLIDVFGLPPQQGGWDGVSVLLIPGLWTKWYPLYWVHLRQARRRVEINHMDNVASMAWGA